MTKIWRASKNAQKEAVSREIFKVGQLMTATELRSAKKYWHIKHKNPDEEIVPKAYTANVVGILWSTMAQFGTWFGAAPYLPYGIQLLPLTPISEERDELDWVNEMYYPFSQACADFHQCTESGWAILQLAILATVGYAEHAASRVKELLPESYENAGGNGQSKSNTIWYIATRPFVQNPVPMDLSDVRGHEEIRPLPQFILSDCHTPNTCTSEVLDRQAGTYTCRARIDWLIHSEGNSQWEACSTVGADFKACQQCSPVATLKNATSPDASSASPPKDDGDEDDTKKPLQCDQCTLEQCNSALNRCPASERTFVCTHGPNRGGCSSSPWTLGREQCRACCEMTHCQRLKDEEAKKITKDGNALEPTSCPPCEASVCYSKVNQCPLHTAPYLCLEGHSLGGCQSTPWNVQSIDEPCTKCCEVTVNC
jgi:Glycosyl hydrolase family 81 C-terminal domain